MFTRKLRQESKGVPSKLVRCADCGCSPEECRVAESPNDCPNCTLEPGCCWTAAGDTGVSGTDGKGGEKVRSYSVGGIGNGGLRASNSRVRDELDKGGSG